MDVVKTKLWVVDEKMDIHNTCPQIKEAAMWITDNEVVAFPTETVYGLGANAYSDAAVEKIFKAKGRPSDNPLIIHISNKGQLQKLVKRVPSIAEKLMEVFWPGPLTLVLEKGEGIAERVTAGLSTVAVRMPDHPVALSLITEANTPVAAPSANVSGKPSPTTAAHVYEDLAGKIAGIVDGGATGVGVESTVLDMTTDIPMILRPGGVTREQLEEVIGSVAVDPALEENGQAPKSPGLKYKHYAPQAKLVLVDGNDEFIQTLVTKAKQEQKKVGVLTTNENVEKFHADVVLPCGTKDDLHTVAQHLYDVLRKFDQYDLDIIYSEIFHEKGVGKAIMNRLTKAAGGDILKSN
ncbi:threonylcarbamoyl-AMP synthase [Anaerobacillus alkalilacustris]|uniref:Threonylcarbamoyl-AMP synthase n=1 Tax=Anaerobacillus alkalilacustris TaxID=393763 RepID=A0A1S2LGX6_9BACI|nr:L-threonylcarbamoyladenylate synthase [Anaerobacillus alkalilacustris]OIJ11758.1 threonylcarbamoyl-AMP synthase [Anaerobacillus alkalilacustris]